MVQPRMQPASPITRRLDAIAQQHRQTALAITIAHNEAVWWTRGGTKN